MSIDTVLLILLAISTVISLLLWRMERKSVIAAEAKVELLMNMFRTRWTTDLETMIGQYNSVVEAVRRFYPEDASKDQRLNLEIAVTSELEKCYDRIRDEKNENSDEMCRILGHIK